MLHPLNENQQNLLHEFKNSCLTMKEFVSNRGINYNSLAYLVWKEKRLNECSSFSLNSFIPIKLNKDTVNSLSNYSDKVNITINGFNINISINDLKELLK